MGLINIKIEKVVIQSDTEILERIEKKLDDILKLSNDTAIIVKAAKDLDTVGNDLKAAVDKNTPS